MPQPRRAYLDWLRGVAVLCMIEWHVVDSWTATDGRGGALWPFIVNIGGMAAPLFLFLAGVSVPFAIASHEARGAAPAEAAWRVQKRGWQVFLIAHLFRLQTFITNPRASWSSIFKPDILNILGLGLALTAWLTGLARRSRDSGEGGTPRRSVLLVIAAIVLLLTPWAARWWWPTLLPTRLEAYIRPNGYGVFELFPWVAYVLVGAYLGSIIAAPRDAAGEVRLHRRIGIEGAVMFNLGYVVASMPLPESVAFWTSVPAHFLLQAGWMTLAVWVAWAWMHTPVAQATSGPLLLFGRTSLFVYWVHIEIAFGFLSYPLHNRLPLSLAIAGFVAVTIAMYFAARWWAGRAKRPLIPTELRAVTDN